MGIDSTVNIFMEGVENSFLIFLSKIIAIALDPIVLVAVSVLIAIALLAKNKKKESLFFILTMGVAAVLIKSLKWIFHKARPLNAIIEETGYSFPSGHATIAVVFFGVLAFLVLTNKKSKKSFDYGKFFCVLSTIAIILFSGFSRIYLRVHWLSDVLAGFVLGGIILFSGIILYRKI